MQTQQRLQGATAVPISASALASPDLSNSRGAALSAPSPHLCIRLILIRLPTAESSVPPNEEGERQILMVE